MTCGIYLLSFEGTDKVYIGQSINIERRYKEHLNRLKRYTYSTADNLKLYSCFINYGNPILNILVRCSEVVLDSMEILYIDEFDSINSGLNIIKGGSNLGSGVSASASKYTREEILKVFWLLHSMEYSYREISNLTKMPLGNVKNIAELRTHVWLLDEFPEQCSHILGKRNERISNSCCAKSRGISYPPIMSPCGKVYNDISNVSEFSRYHGLNKSHVTGVLNGVRKSHKGWVLYNGS